MNVPKPTASQFSGTVEEAFQVALQCFREGDWAKAGRLCRQLVQHCDKEPGIWHLWGLVALNEHRDRDAVNRFERAIALRPDEPAYHNMLGEAHRALGDWDQAHRAYRRALEVDPASAEAHSNIGLAWREAGQLDEAAAAYERAVELDPRFADARFGRALLWLLQGNYERGWPEYEWRFSRAVTPSPHMVRPRWDGSPVSDKTVLIHSEQGLGDAFQFVRYLPLVKQRAGQVVFECEPLLRPIFRDAAGVDVLVAKGEPTPPFDLQAPLLGLPGLFGSTLDNLPAAVPYLAADPRIVAQWRERLKGERDFKVGIAWQGSKQYFRDAVRSIPLRQFAPLAAVPGVRLLSLQKGEGIEQHADARFSIVELGSRVDSAAGPFMDTAAIIQSLDLVVSSDTAVAHLAGALGAPVWLALSAAPDWRWLSHGQSCAWYPTMRIFRQRRLGDWEDVFRQMADALTVEQTRRTPTK